MKATGAVLAAAVIAVGLAVVVAEPAAATNTAYYVDCSASTNGSCTGTVNRPRFHAAVILAASSLKWLNRSSPH